MQQSAQISFRHMHSGKHRIFIHVVQDSNGKMQLILAHSHVLLPLEQNPAVLEAPF